MSDYDDSFEAETTSSDEEQERHNNATASPHASIRSEERPNSGSGPAPTKSADSPLTSTPPPVPVAAAAASPVAVAPGVGPVPLPVPLPVPVPQPEKSTATVNAAVATAFSSKGSGSDASSSAPLPMPRSRGGALTSPLFDGGSTSASQSGTDAWRRSTAQSSSHMSASDSAGVPQEMLEAATRAGEGAEFQALSNFVAFGSGRASTATATRFDSATTSQRTSEAVAPPLPAASQVPRQFVAFPSSSRASSSNEATREASAPSSAESQPASPPQLAEASPQKTPSEAKSASVAPSSVFSTLSQHLQTPAAQSQPPPPLPQPSAPTASTSLLPPPAPVPAPAPLVATTAAAAAPSSSAAPPPLAAATETGQSPAPAAAAATVPVTVSLTLPSLPPPSWATANATTTTTTNAAAAAASAPPPLLSSSAGSGAAAETVALGGRLPSAFEFSRDGPSLPARRADVVAPLPPPPESYRVVSAEEARVSELREASEAVERLVKAFAMLKGYGSLESRPHHVDAAMMAESAATTTAHRPGATYTVKARPVPVPRGPRVPSVATATAAPTKNVEPPTQRGGSVGDADRERLAEDLVLDCVLNLLQEHARGAEGGAPASGLPWQAARPHYEVVTADAFTRSGGVGGSAAPRVSFPSAPPLPSPRAGYGTAADGDVPGIDVPLFDPRDRHSATDFYNVVQDALGKYVMRRIRTAEPSASPATPATSPLPVTHITCAFAWALLLDMSSVCQEIARCAYDAAAASPSPVYPILVQFTGDAAAAEMARTAMHCLPFEALRPVDVAHTPSSSLLQERGCLFRMASWVTQEQLWTISDALADTVRADVVKRSAAAQYAPFSTATTTTTSDIDPRLLVPPSVPMFTMRPLPSRKKAPAHGSLQPFEREAPLSNIGRAARDPSTTASAQERDLFDVPAGALQTVAYNVSKLATDVLASAASTDGVLAGLSAEAYPDVAVAVSETVTELLEDEAIKAAVQRRTTEKLKKMAMQKTVSATATRQRKEQAIIDKAEKEAEEVVQRILQEMRAQGVRS